MSTADLAQPWERTFPERLEVRGVPVVLEIESDPWAPFALITAAELRE